MTESFEQLSAPPNGPNPTAIPPDELARMTDDIVAALKTVYDPEIPADIYELGLIYRIEINDDREVAVEMTLTAPGCGMGEVIADEVREKLESLPRVAEVSVESVFDPPWDRSMMSEAAQLALGL